uniref:PDZ domain-containing protein n=1 Tax=Poecilia formosa TaxID=48698 RepID=A0A087YNM3_POEFO
KSHVKNILTYYALESRPKILSGRRLRAPEPATQDDSICEEPTQFAEGERPRPQGSSPVQEYPEGAKYADKEVQRAKIQLSCTDMNRPACFNTPHHLWRCSRKEAPSPEGGVIVNTAQDGCAEGLVYGGGGKEGIFIKKVVPESPASKSLKVKEVGDQILSATVYFDNMSYEDAIQILEHAQAYKLKLCLKRQPDITETEPTIDSDVIPVTILKLYLEEDVGSTEMREQGKTRRRGDARISWPKFPSFGKGRKSRFTRSHSSSEADEQRKLELSPTTSDTESPAKSQDALKGKKKHKRRRRVRKSPKKGDDKTQKGKETKLKQSKKSSPKPDSRKSQMEDRTSPTKCKEIAEAEKPQVEIEPTETEEVTPGKKEGEAKGYKIKMPQLGIALPKVTTHESDLSLSKKAKDLTLPEVKASKPEITVPFSDAKAEVKVSQVDGEKINFSSPVVVNETPEVEIPTMKAENHLDGQEEKGPDVEQSPSKFSMPTFKLPKLGLGTSDKNVEGDDIDKDIPDEVLEVTIVAPSSDLSNIDVDTHLLESKVEVALSSDDVNKYSIEVEATAPQIKVEGSPSKFKMPTFKLPKFGLSVQRSTEEEPPLDKDLKTGEGEITTSGEILSPSLEEPRIDVKAPAVDLKTTGTESEGRGRKFKLPSLGFSSSQSKGPDSDITLPTTDVDITLPTADVDVTVPQVTEGPSVEIEDLSIESKKQGNEHEGKGKRFKLPSLGFSATQTKVPDTDLSLKTGVDVTQPELKAEVKFPDDELKRIETEIETKGPEFQVEAKDIGGSTSKFKMPTFKLPKFGLATQSSTEEVPSFDKEGPSVEIKGTSVDFSTEGSDLEGKGRKFKLPSLSFSVPQAKETETDLSLRTDVEVKVPEVKAEVKLPSNKSSVEVETKALETKEAPTIEIKGPLLELKTEGIDHEEKGKKFTTEEPSIKIKGPSVDLRSSETDDERKGSKFKLPSLGFSLSQSKGPHTNISLPKADVDVTAPEVKAEVHFSDAKVEQPSVQMDVKSPEIKVEATPAPELDPGLKKSKFSLPRFSFSKPSLKEPEVKADLPDHGIELGEGAAVIIKGPKIDFKSDAPKSEQPDQETLNTESDSAVQGSPSKFKLPTFKIPRLGLSRSKPEDES